MTQILLRAPGATGVLFDQPQVVAEAARLEQAGLSMRTELVGGDFFESMPEGGSCYVIKGVLHDFDDEQCVRILSNCREAMETGGRVVIANQDLPTPVDGPHPNLTMDIQMMVLLTGRERSVDQWGTLFRQAGLRIGEATGTRVAFTVVDGVAEKRE